MRLRFSQLVAAFLLSFFVVLAPLPALAAGDYGLKATADAAGLKTNKSIPQLVGQIVGAGLSLLGIVFLGLMIYGGFRWMTARGDTKSVDTAKDTITNAVIGFAIVAGAYAITDFAIGAITSGTAGGGGGGGQPEMTFSEEESLEGVEELEGRLRNAECNENCVNQCTFDERFQAPDVTTEQCVTACQMNC